VIDRGQTPLWCTTSPTFHVANLGPNFLEATDQRHRPGVIGPRTEGSSLSCEWKILREQIILATYVPRAVDISLDILT
jgi:hypothetical protein